MRSFLLVQKVRTAILAGGLGFLTVLATQGFPVRATTLPASPTAHAEGQSAVSLLPSMFGVNVSGWDPWMLSASGVSAIKSMGFGVQQFPNCPWIYNWSTNKSLNNGQWYPIPVSMNQWSNELTQTNNTGLYIIPYGFNRSGTGGASVGTVTRLTEYIVQHHEPISAMVIGSEQYGGWAQNLHQRQTALRYAQLSVQMATAIHTIDPAMKVGVDYDLPANVTQPNAQSTQWNRTVISMTAPYVQFVSVHIYPLTQVQGNVSLLQSLHSQLGADMSYVTQQVNQYSGASVNKPAVWVTEFNPYGLESAQSVQPVFGSALVQSYLQMMSLGAKQVDWWAMYGDAHVPQAPGTVATNTPLATGANAPFASNGLASEGIAPQPQPENTLYPTGAAYAELMQLVGTHSTLQIDSTLYNTYHVFAAAILHRTYEDWVVINDSHQTATVDIANQHQTISSTGMAVFKDVPLATLAPTAATTLQNSRTTQMSSSNPVVLGVNQHQVPTITSAVWDPTTQLLTITGSGLDIPTSEIIPAPGQGIDQSHLQITDLNSNAGYGWTYKGVNTDWYGVTPMVWTNTSIILRLDGPMPQSGDNLEVSWWTPIGFSDINSFQVPVKWVAPVAQAPLGVITGASYAPATQTLTINGSNFGNAPSETPAPSGGYDQTALEILIRGSNIQYGYAGNHDWYGILIEEWTPSQIVVRLATPPAPGQPVQVTWMPTNQSLAASS